MNQLEPAEQQQRLIGAKRHRSSTDILDLSWTSPFTRAKAAMEAGAAGGAQEGARPYVSSKSMGAMRRLPLSNGASAEAAPVQQQQVVYSSLDDISTRVEIYKGRHSIVWNAICAKTKKPIILKGYVKAKMTERNFHQVRREIRLMQQINYDGAVKLLGHFEDSTTIYLVQELCAKGDLFKRLIRYGGMMDEKFVAGEVILPMLLTLEHLHARSIYHRDIKPENIFFTREGKFKLGDFGLAIDASLERSKSRVGTLDYMSPEVVSLPTADERKKMEIAGRQVTEQPYGEKCDIWACGVLAYELLVGKPPFEVKDEMETRKRIMYETTLTLPPHVSPEAVNFIKTALAKNAGMRPAAADLVHHAWLRPYLLAMAAASGQLDAATLSAYKNPPSLAASSSVAAAAALGSNPSSSAAAAAQGNSSMFAASAGVGRSASFTGMSRQGINSVPGRVQINVNVGDAAAAAGPEAVAEKLNRHNLSHLSVALNHYAHGSASPTMPTTPGPYGPPGMSRKPVWDR
ncbi:hypothetical protein OEZ86_008368 [Tetradesmus obliquus]|nr:hypothetical protein OEZ86_008368 [Tetradesmus obliquus]